MGQQIRRQGYMTVIITASYHTLIKYPHNYRFLPQPITLKKQKTKSHCSFSGSPLFYRVKFTKNMNSVSFFFIQTRILNCTQTYSLFLCTRYCRFCLEKYFGEYISLNDDVNSLFLTEGV